MSPRWFWRLSNRQFVLSRDTSDIIISPRENSWQQKRHYTHHPLNFHFCHLFSYYHHKISSCSQPFHYGQLFSYFQHLHFRHRPLFSFHCPTTFTGSTGKRNFSQDQYARGTFHRINMQEELFTGSTCTRNFSQDQHALRTSHRINMQEELILGSTCMRIENSRQQKRHHTHHPLNFHFCHLFLTIIIKFHPALSLFLVSPTVNRFLTFNTFTSAIGPYFPSIVQQPL